MAFRALRIVAAVYLFALAFFFGWAFLSGFFAGGEVDVSLSFWFQHIAAFCSLVGIARLAFGIPKLSRLIWKLIALLLAVAMVFELSENGLLHPSATIVGNIAVSIIYGLLAVLPLSITVYYALRKS